MSNTKYTPILYSTPMVQGIQEGIKNITRRTKGLECVNKNPNQWRFDRFELDIEFNKTGAIFSNDFEEQHITCPYGKVGDVLWVRETFQIRDSRKPNEITFKADDEVTCAPWKPSIFLKKKDARIFLEIIDIRVERLQDITEKDSIAEGAPKLLNTEDLKRFSGLGSWTFPYPFGFFQYGFVALWCSINGVESWLHNPFVWVIEFKKIDKPLDFNV